VKNEVFSFKKAAKNSQETRRANERPSFVKEEVFVLKTVERNLPRKQKTLFSAKRMMSLD